MIRRSGLPGQMHKTSPRITLRARPGRGFDAAVSVVPQLRLTEAAKSYARRVSERWFEQYAPFDRSGIDIGGAFDPLNDTFRRWDKMFGNEDVTEMKGVLADQFHTVHAGYILQRIGDPVTAICNWYRICRAPGHVIICVPHRDLYERKNTLPSKWNPEHRWFFLPEAAEQPVTLSLRETILKAVPDANIVSLRVFNENYSNPSPNRRASGEYSIEAIIFKDKD